MHHVRGHCLFCSGDVQMVFWTTTITPELYSRHELSVRVFFFFPFLSCLQCPQWKAQATGATSWRSAWRSTIQLTRLSTRTPELLFLRTTAAPHTTGELLQLRLRNLRSELWMREEVSHLQMHVCCSLSLLFCVLLSLQIKKNYFTLYFSACVRRRFNLVLRSCDLKDSKPCNHEVRLFLSSCLSSPLFLSVLTHD